MHQSSQASASHLVSGVLRGLQKRRPALFNLYTPCPVEHGLADDWASSAAKLALESRAFPFITYDPDAGPLVSDALSLDGNPSVDERWPTYGLDYLNASGVAQRMELPLTIADWAATEGRFRKHFTDVPPEAWNEDMVPFHEFIDLSPEEREGKTPFIHTLDREKRLARMSVAVEIVALAEERLHFWAQLKELAGIAPSASVRERLVSEVEAAYEEKLAAMRADYERQLVELRSSLPQALARRMADALIRGAGPAVLEKMAAAPAPVTAPAPAPAPAAFAAPAPAPVVATAPSPVAPAAPVAAATVVDADGDLTVDPYIDSARCTTCNECTNLNGKMFGYNGNKQATIKDPRAGTFQQLVLAAERCPVSAIHPGTPLNPREKDLPKWLERAKPFN